LKKRSKKLLFVWLRPFSVRAGLDPPSLTQSPRTRAIPIHDFVPAGHRRACVIGWPVDHSRSPRLHNFWLGRYGIDGSYGKLAVPPGGLAKAVRGLLADGYVGANVTIPHKEAALSVCDRITKHAAIVGAVNTFVFEGGEVHGSNTDGAGFLANVRDQGGLPAGPALILGAGGAARAIAAALLGEGLSVTVANRSRDRAEALAAALPGVSVLPWEQRDAAVADMALLVNTTSLGMQGQPALSFDFTQAASDLVVADVVYVPLRTRFLDTAAERGLRTVEGLGMLLHQAVPGFAAWFGVTPVVDEDVRTLLASGIPPYET
jgi:shikimate dehydrogenase